VSHTVHHPEELRGGPCSITGTAVQRPNPVSSKPTRNGPDHTHRGLPLIVHMHTPLCHLRNERQSLWESAKASLHTRGEIALLLRILGRNALLDRCHWIITELGTPASHDKTLQEIVLRELASNSTVSVLHEYSAASHLL